VYTVQVDGFHIFATDGKVYVFSRLTQNETLVLVVVANVGGSAVLV
jgi:hypothetical protein